MSLMGYTEEDVNKWMDVLHDARVKLKDDPYYVQNLREVYDFFECLVIEGRV